MLDIKVKVIYKKNHNYSKRYLLLKQYPESIHFLVQWSICGVWQL